MRHKCRGYIGKAPLRDIIFVGQHATAEPTYMKSRPRRKSAQRAHALLSFMKDRRPAAAKFARPPISLRWRETWL